MDKDYLIEDILSITKQNINHILNECGSPIEEIFLLRLMGYLAIDGGCNISMQNKSISLGEMIIYPQYHIKENIRVDFLITFRDKKLVVECDGHDFHEKTKEQAQKDKSRDRTIQLSGCAVMRFTGSEIYKDIDSVLMETMRFITKDK